MGSHCSSSSSRRKGPWTCLCEPKSALYVLSQQYVLFIVVRSMVQPAAIFHKTARFNHKLLVVNQYSDKFTYIKMTSLIMKKCTNIPATIRSTWSRPTSHLDKKFTHTGNQSNQWPPPPPTFAVMVASQDQVRVRNHGRSHRSGHRTSSGGYPVRGHRPHRSGHRISNYHHYKYTDDDFESIISPCVKYSLFFFNFVFWVSRRLMQG